MRRIKVYLEGGGPTKYTQIPFRKSFDKLFGELKLVATTHNCDLTFLPRGGKDETISDFETAFDSPDGSFILLLVDSHGLVSSEQTPKDFLRINRSELLDHQCHLMVQFMESWFIADINALRLLYSKELTDKFLKIYEDVDNVEIIDQSEIEKALDSVSEIEQGVYTEYGKIKQAVKILENLNLDIVRIKATHCDKFCNAIETLIINQP